MVSIFFDALDEHIQFFVVYCPVLSLPWCYVSILLLLLSAMPVSLSRDLGAYNAHSQCRKERSQFDEAKLLP